MGKIKKLPAEVAELIAAGEVVERPASVVKELIENSIDAGATKIKVEADNGGIVRIRVTDNGCGISREDLPIAFLRNATSKISNQEDLYAINTLGFRGEALAAISAVSHVDVLTKTKDSAIGTHISADGGVIGVAEDAGCPDGTIISVRELFYNTPARLKFMKRDATEAGYIAAVVSRAALSNPEISFCFEKDGKQELLTPGDGQLISAAYAVYGREFADGLINVSAELDGICVFGLATKPENSRASRTMQNFFVNGRSVISKTLCAAFERAYKERIMVGKFPACILNVDINPLAVDVNVHPTKLEIKFADDSRVFNAVYTAVSAALDGDTNRPVAEIKTYNDNRQTEKQVYRPIQPQTSEQFNIFKKEATADASAEQPQMQSPYEISVNKIGGILFGGNENSDDKFREKVSPSFKTSGNASFENYMKRAAQSSEPQSEVEKPESENEVSDFCVIGELHKTYILVEDEDGLLMIDKHAAHERIIFNQLESRKGDESAQVLISPETISLSPEDAAILLENKDIVDDIGYDIESFGTGTVLVRKIPMYSKASDTPLILSELAEKLKNGHISKPEIYTKILETVACKAAVKAHSFTDDTEREAFVKKLLSMPDVKYCPHGRPVVIRLTNAQLEKMFRRTQ